MQLIGKYLVIAGIVLAVIGGILWLSGNKLNWFGHLPGDIRVERQNFKFYAPFASMLLLSILISVVLWLIRKLF
ncbi:MAG: DUF2905 domain-containing protein [Hymenobacteraceae bacterium]|nr:DUF2905 domain-containing protein [Hymenobacteraceae bacterium]MDX5395149.1 DUF2905 domain-containing protein [Hymenobacteraceae bacterium]MDX5442311.1 DUF2905 domain-containing protein [Hymenobacteraceae bacterium]MDX5511190.1 DUF2905 domain-containing protein [Hymenobacteraceae bacterium]